ncbi:molybdate ABC transporter substrate-binding protein [Pimelobacter simplex]|uniref:molybdate ABC transporter substrate-binding protein n=1 Tax=Nocardioides simplex TaxID=2045 RepID=UPI00214FC921|nr:molybdate ABC transporter substrate-binding protein [Pimelobacter simplex]UUW92547.1 molybdate ABC transporter substrate-binding protein [Pimelobacter simplex]UUW96374.1 molybdate ABC transporter substrate-binding protein [Pimelobacter simplex]
MKRLFTTLAALALVAGTAACGDDGDSGDGGGDGGDTTLTVYAAASLTSTFEQLGESFEESHDGVSVEFNFAGSSNLVAQIQQGAPADVFASADEANMEKLTADGLEGSDPELFATNILEIAIPPDNPAGIQSFQDLANPDINLVICAPEVPCGAAAQSVADNAGVELQPDSEEQSVTDVLAKVVSGEADAGLVYVTDVIAAGEDVQGIEFPESESVVNNYPIATVAESENADLAQEFVDLVLSDEGQQVLADAGFGQP